MSPARTGAVRTRPWARRLGRSTSAALLAVLAVATTTGLWSGPLAAQAATVDRAAAATQCRLAYWNEQPDDAQAAREVLAGRVQLGKYGTFTLAANPSWAAQKTLDASGNANIHALYWALPLLREGVRTGDRRMVDRFYAVVQDWVRDNPPGAGNGWGMYRLLVEGQRQLTLACAAAGPRGAEPWVAAALAAHVAFLTPASHWDPRDNTALYQQIGLFAAACSLRDARAKALAIARQGEVTRRIVHPDGSSTEGATSYSAKLYTWISHAQYRVKACGATPDPALTRVERIPDFIAASTRPDGRLEPIGDSVADPVHVPSVLGTVAEYAGTLGASGPRPSTTFRAFAGGFVLGRSGWGTERPFADETAYSVRFGTGFPQTYHGHHDIGALTLFAHRTPLLLDSGQYGYTNDTKRAFVQSRAAHTTVTVTGVADSAAVPARLLTASSGRDGDVVDLIDPSYSAAGVSIRRTVLSSRAGGWLLVVDRVDARRAVQVEQRWNTPTGRTLAISTGRAATTGSAAGLSMRWLAGGQRLQVLTGSTAPWGGWTTPEYGRLAPSPQVRALVSGTNLVLATIVVPRGAGVPDSAVTVSGTVGASTAEVTVSAGGTQQRWRLVSGSAGTTADLLGPVMPHRRSAARPQPVVVPAARGVAPAALGGQPG